MWTIFEEELWSWFGPTKCEDFDEALSRVKQIAMLYDYEQDFEKLGDSMHCCKQKGPNDNIYAERGKGPSNQKFQKGFRC